MNIPSPFSPLPLSVIVVSADSGPGLRDCVRHVLACTTSLELLLIDNASADGVPQAVARAREHDPRFRLIQSHTNLGFGRAVNRAAAQAKGELLLVLNPDCLLEQTSLDRLLAVFASEKQVGLLGAVACDEQGVPDPASHRRDPLLRRALASLSGGKGERVEVEGAMPDGLVEAEAVSGALMLLPRHVFERLHGFDEGYFLHCEDLDLCRRVRDAGWRVMLAGDVRVPHTKGGSSRHRPIFVSRHKHRGMWRWFRKFDPAARNPLVAATVWLGIWAHFLVQLPGQLMRRASGK
ncbi:glycosyltransferase family 2 protein [Rhodanobacter hydrolyticus]|uniref:glycosyltransferase family 2 protein n=1 Tax=Rhodanobacter hydrolyticus TaxID=2250595 RepID=UPI00384C1C51